LILVIIILHAIVNSLEIGSIFPENWRLTGGKRHLTGENWRVKGEFQQVERRKPRALKPRFRSVGASRQKQAS
jgi:hypothetical protein